MKPLPASVEEIAAIIGRDEALRLIAELPTWRTRNRSAERPLLYIPKRIAADHRLARILGLPDAQRLVAAFGGEVMHLGNCRGLYRGARDAFVREERARGVPVSVVAKRAGISERQVRNIVRAA